MINCRLFWILISCTVIFSGCASTGFNRGALKEQMGVKPLASSDTEIKEILKKKPNLPKPFKLAVYFKRPKTSADARSPWRWSEEDRNLILAISEDLKVGGMVSEVFPIVGSLVQDEDLRSVRVAAAKQGADAVLIVDGAGQVDRYINKAGWTYVLLVPALFVPGSEVDTLFMTSASMWDVRNEYLYLAAESEGKAHQNYVPAFGKTDEELFAEARGSSLKSLRAEIGKMISGVKR